MNGILKMLFRYRKCRLRKIYYSLRFPGVLEIPKGRGYLYIYKFWTVKDRDQN